MKKMRAVLATLLSMVIILSLSVIYVAAATEDGTEGYYTFTKFNSKVTITDVDNSISGNVVVPSTIDGCDVITIGEYAFEGCDKVTSITIPESITTINRGAFKGMTSLESVTLPFTGKTASVTNYTSTFGYVFDYTSEETEGAVSQGNGYYYYIPSSIKSITVTADTDIPNYAFYGLTNLESVSLPKATTVGNYAFRDCSSLKSASVDSATSIGNYAFYNCTSLSTINMPKVTSVGNYAFYGCSAFAELPMSDTLVTIGEFAYAEISNITTLVVPEGVTSIGRGAFKGLNKLTSVSVPFTGNTKDASGYSGVFGYIFDYTTTSGTSGTTQQYSSGSTYYYYYIPTTIKSITITNDAGISANAFYNCANVTNVNIESATSIGSYAFYNCEKLATISLPENLKTIGDYAFYNFNGLTSIVIPNSVTSIGNYAFQNCSNLETVIFSNSLETIGSSAFSGCSKIKELNLPTSLKTIGEYSFSGLSLITELVVPDSVTSIGEGAFKGMNKLEEITLPFVGQANGSTSSGHYGYGIFGYIFGANSSGGTGTIHQDFGSYSSSEEYFFIPQSLRIVTITKETKIDNYAFHNCSFLTEINIPETVTSIGYCAFYNCSGITEFDIPDTITTISSSVFRECTNLGNVELPENLKTIESYAFYNCDGFTTVVLPNTVTSIGNYAFQNCSNLETVIFSNSLETIGSSAFSGCSKIKELNLPTSLKTIGEYSFSGLSLITELVVPDSVTSIGEGAFKGMNKLEEITLPFVGQANGSTSSGHYGYGIFGYIFGANSSGGTGTIHQDFGSYSSSEEYFFIPQSLRIVTITKETKIDNYAFHNCSFLTEINIPETVTSIGTKAFYNCSGLTSLHISKNVISVGSNAFSGCSNLTVFGHSGSYIETYCNDNSVPFVPYENIVSIAVKQAPTNKQYLGKSVDTTGLILTATLSDGSTADFNTGYTVDVEKYTKAGENTVTISCNGKETSFKVNVTGISSISVVNTPSKTEYFVGNTLDTSGLTLKVTYIDGTNSFVNSGITTNVTTLNKAGNQIVKVTYYTASTYITVKVHPVNISNVEIATLPTQLAYYVGDTVNTAGLTLNVTYTDGSSAVVDSGFTVDTVIDSTDITKVVIDYNGFKVSYDIVVEAFEMVAWEMTSEPTKLSYYVGDSIDTTGLVITAYYSNGTTGEITSGFTCTPDKFEEIGEQIVIVNYKGSEAMFVVEVSERPHEHSHESTITKEPTCLEEGVKTFTCECGDSYTETVSALGHSYDSVVTNPTCTENGYTTYTCANCDDSYVSDEVSALGHTEVTLPSVTPNCTETGLTEGVKCSVCDEIITEQEVVPANGHDFDYTMSEDNLIRPTESSDGYYTFTCKNGCGTTEIQTVKSADYSAYNEAETTIKGYLTNPDITDAAKQEIIDAIKQNAQNSEYFDENGNIRKDLTESEQHIVDTATSSAQEHIDSIEVKISNGEYTKPDYSEIDEKINEIEEILKDTTISDEMKSELENIKKELEELKKNEDASQHDVEEALDDLMDRLDEITSTIGKCANGNHSFTNYVTTKEAGCETNGVKTATCDNGCGATDEEVILAVGHNMIKDNAVAPDCTNTGLTEGSHCSRCDYKIAQEVIPATGHTYTSEVTKTPTHTESGVRTYTCNCGHSYNESIEVTGDHAYVDSITKEATCTSVGEITYICVCGSSYTEEIPALGHDYAIDYTVDIEATCTTEGSKSQHCSRCDSNINVTTIPAVGHNFGIWVIIVEPTCTNDGEQKRTCNACGDYETNAVESTGHNYVDGTCDNCGQKDPSIPVEPEYNYTFKIQTPSMTTIRHKDGIKLHTKLEGTAPAGSYVKWTASNSNFKTEEINNGNSYKIISDKNGTTTFTATLYSAEGEVLATDTIEMKSKAGFFDKIGSFFRSLFGGTKIHEN